MTIEDAVEDHVSECDRRRDPDEGRFDRGYEGVLVPRVPAVVEHARLISDVEHRRDTVLHEGGPQLVVIGMTHRSAVDGRRSDHRQLHSGAVELGELRLQPLGVAQGEVSDRMQARTRVGDNRRAPAIPRRHVRGERGQRRRQATLPQQPEVGEAHRFVETDLVEPPHARPRTPIRVGERVVVHV